MGKSKKSPVDRATATIRKATGNDALKVSTTSSVIQAMKQSPNWAAATGVQAAVAGWSKAASVIEAGATGIANLRAQLKSAEAAQAAARRDWETSKLQVTTEVTVFAAGSADTVTGFNLDVVTHDRIGPLGAPIDLTVNPAKEPGQILAAWAKGVAKHGFIAQHATDPSTAATYSATVPCTKPKLLVSGLTSGSSLSFRVAAIDPTSATGMSPWSAWVVGNAR
jgi:hypothetical protein